MGDVSRRDLRLGRASVLRRLQYRHVTYVSKYITILGAFYGVHHFYTARSIIDLRLRPWQWGQKRVIKCLCQADFENDCSSPIDTTGVMSLSTVPLMKYWTVATRKPRSDFTTSCIVFAVFSPLFSRLFFAQIRALRIVVVYIQVGL
jgi:hypothetical protein